jgi:hypothetical protein
VSFKEVKAAFDAMIEEDQPPSAEDFKLWQLKLAFEIFGCLDSISHSQRELLKIEQAREAQRLKTLEDLDTAMRRKAALEKKSAQYLKD